MYYFSGFNPVWNEEFMFSIDVPELALVRFVIYDSDRYIDDFIGYYVVPFNSLMQGTYFKVYKPVASYRQQKQRSKCNAFLTLTWK